MLSPPGRANVSLSRRITMKFIACKKLNGKMVNINSQEIAAMEEITTKEKKECVLITLKGGKQEWVVDTLNEILKQTDK